MKNSLLIICFLFLLLTTQSWALYRPQKDDMPDVNEFINRAPIIMVDPYMNSQKKSFKEIADEAEKETDKKFGLRTPIYTIYSWKEFCAKYGHCWDDGFYYMNHPDFKDKAFAPIKTRKCKHCGAFKIDETKEKIWYEDEK